MYTERDIVILGSLHNAVQSLAQAEKHKENVINPKLKRVTETGEEIEIFADKTIQLIWKGYIYGVLRQANLDGLGGVAEEVLYNAKNT